MNLGKKTNKKSYNLEGINSILNKIMKWETDIKGILLLDGNGKIISHKIRPKIEKQWDINYIGIRTGTVFKEYKKLQKYSNFKFFQWIIAEYDHGKITSIPLDDYILCIIGHVCPSIGGVRLILAQTKDDLLKSLP